MWDLLKKLSRGRISARYFSLLAITAVMTFFVTSLAISPSASAIDVTRTGSTVTYQNNTYSVATQDTIPKDITERAPATGYYYIDNAANKAHFILTSSTDPGQANTGYYVVYDFTPPANYSKGSPPTDVTFVANGGTAQNTKPTSGCSDSTLSGIGWIVCPTVNFIAKGMDKIYEIISNFLVVRTVTNDTNSSLYQLWMMVRDLANICFVIALLVIVYSQITSFGISNYGIKKMLPRIVAAAIMVNISFWICAVAVDVSNILGYAIHGMFTGILDKFSVGANYSGDIPSWEQVAALSLAGAGATAGGIFVLSTTISGTLPLFIPFLVSAVLAAMVALIVLAVRQALITILIIVSPLAFVAFILPNTEKYFKKWQDTLMTMLMLFPIFSVIFSGAQLAGMAIVQSAGGNLFTIILGMAVQVAPIVITPILVKFSGSLVGKIAGMVNNPNRGLVDRSRNWAKGVSAEQKNKVLAGQNRHFRKNPMHKATRALDTRRRHQEGRRKAYEAMADNRFAGTKKGFEVEAMNRSTSNDKQRIENMFANSQRGRQLELQNRNLGVDKQEIENSVLRSDGGKHLTYRQNMAEVDKTRVHNEFEESHLGHQSDIAKRTVENEKKIIENTHQGNWDDSVRTNTDLYDLNLNVKASEVKAALSKAKLEKIDAEVSAQGHQSEHILNLRGSDERIAGMLNIAHGVKKDNLEAAIAATAKGMAERVVSEDRTTALSDNTITIDGKTIVEYAAGIKGVAGERAVTAKAKSEVSAVMMEDIKNIQNTMKYELATDNDALYNAIKSTDVLTEKVAYAKALYKNGAPGVGVLRKVFSEIGDPTKPTLVKKEDLLDFKEILASEPGMLSAGKDMEAYLTNRTDPSGKPMVFDDISKDIGTWTNLSAVAFANQNASTQKYALQYLHDNDHPAYTQVIESLRANPAAHGALKQSIYEKFSVYSDSQIRSAQKRGQPLPSPGTLIP